MRTEESDLWPSKLPLRQTVSKHTFSSSVTVIPSVSSESTTSINWESTAEKNDHTFLSYSCERCRIFLTFSWKSSTVNDGYPNSNTASFPWSTDSRNLSNITRLLLAELLWQMWYRHAHTDYRQHAPPFHFKLLFKQLLHACKRKGPEETVSIPSCPPDPAVHAG